MRGFVARYGPNLILFLLSITAVSFIAIVVEPFNPDFTCCDHLYYRGQAEFWGGLGPANMSDIPNSNVIWSIVQNQETYYEFANGLTAQPPYVFRPLVPILAGLIGHLTGLNTAFYLITFVSIALIGYLTGLTTHRLSGNLWLSASVAVGASLLPEAGSRRLENYMLVEATSLAIVAAVLYLVVSKRWVTAAIVTGIVAPLTKETLVTLALCVAIAAFLCGVRYRWLWILPIAPVIVQGLLRVLISVPIPPPILEMFIPGDQIRPAVTLMTSFVAVSFLFYGLVSQRLRITLVAFTPLFLLLIVITSSIVADSLRIWLTVWPVVLVLGAVGLHAFLRESPTRFLWIPLPLLACIWLYFGVDFKSTNQIVYFLLDYGLILVPPVLIGLEYVWRQASVANRSVVVEGVSGTMAEET